MIKKIGQSKRMFVEDDLIDMHETLDYAILNDKYKPTEKEIRELAQELWNIREQRNSLKEKQMLKRDKSVIKLMEMSKGAGIIKERKRIIKLFKFELDNRVTSYNTLEKLDKIKKEIKK